MNLKQQHLCRLIFSLLLATSPPVLASPADDLTTAVQQGNGVLAEQALNAGADPNTPILFTNILVWATKYNNLKLVTLALEKGANPNSLGTVDQSGSKSALQVAAENKQFEIFQLLMGKGASMTEATMDVLVKSGDIVRLDWVLKHHRPADEIFIRGYEYILDDYGGIKEEYKVDVFQWLLKAYPIAKVPKNVLTSGLYNSSRFGYEPVVKLLLSQTTWDMYETGTNEYTVRAFYMVGNEGHKNIAERFFQKWQKEPRASKAFGEMLHGAAVGGHVDIMKLVIANIGVERLPQADFNEWVMRAATFKQAEALQLMLTTFGKSKFTPELLFAGIIEAFDMSCDPEKTNQCQASWQFFLDQGLNINAVNKAGQPVLVAAVNKDANAQVFKWLLSKGANPNLTDKQGHNALFYAKERENVDAIKLFLAHGSKSKITPDEAFAGNLATSDIFAMLQSQYGQDKAWWVKTKQGQTLLHRAVSRWEVDFVKIALSKGLSVKEKDYYAETPLLALLSDETTAIPYIEIPQAMEIATLLLAKGADVNAQDKQGLTLLHRLYATYMTIDVNYDKHYDNTQEVMKMQDFAQWLLDKGANPQLKDTNGQTALALAQKFRSEMNDYRDEFPEVLKRMDALIQKMQQKK